MKRNINLLILGCEIAAIVILHAFKMNQPGSTDNNTNNSISKTNQVAPLVRHYPLLSIK